MRRVRYVDLDSEEQEVVEVSSGDNSESEDCLEKRDPLPLQWKRKVNDFEEHYLAEGDPQFDPTLTPL